MGLIIPSKFDVKMELYKAHNMLKECDKLLSQVLLYEEQSPYENDIIAIRKKLIAINNKPALRIKRWFIMDDIIDLQCELIQKVELLRVDAWKAPIVSQLNADADELKRVAQAAKEELERFKREHSV